MASVEELNTATNSKLDDLAEMMASLADWMKSMDDTTAGLAKNTAFLTLHAEDMASRLNRLETDAATRQPPGPALQTPPSAVVQVDTNRQPQGRGEAHLTRGAGSGSLETL